MLSFRMMDSQEAVIPVPTTGLDRRGRAAPIEGPATWRVEVGAEFIEVSLDPDDPTGMSVLAKAVVDPSTPGNGPWLVAGTIFGDAQIGSGESLIGDTFAIEITTGQAASIALGQPTIREQPAP